MYKSPAAPTAPPKARMFVISFAFYSLENGECHYHLEMGMITESEARSRIKTSEKVAWMKMRYFEADPSSLPKLALTMLKFRIEHGVTRSVDWFLNNAPIEFLEYKVAQRLKLAKEEKARTGT